MPLSNFISDLDSKPILLAIKEYVSNIIVSTTV